MAIRVGITSVNLHLVLDDTMEVHERANVFHVNKAVFVLQGNQLNLPATMDGVIYY